ncbi:uncharacterized protein V1513DRAFT_444550 [Lipomyces chichibuensis]|uniref:uncharacterized protein n=1 Tax=Lipomyces chichibuensis TaxID=1546026 RepID=UPI003343DCB2
MADDEEAARQEKLAAARKRFEELKKQQDKKPKKKGTKKGKSDSESATTSSRVPERTDSPATVAAGKETPPPPEESVAVVEEVDDAAGALHEEDQGVDKDAKAHNEYAAVIAELRGRIDALELENAALKDSLVTANAKIQLDATTISSLQTQMTKTPVLSPTPGAPALQQQPPMSPSKRDEYYRTLEEKFSREAQERYLLERDYAALARTHEKLVTSHNAVVVELERLKMRFSAEEKRRQMPDNGDEHAIDEKQALAARERAANINARISAGTSSLFRTAQGFSAAVVKGVTGGASAVIDGGAPAMMRRVSSNKSGRMRASSSSSYADVDLYADDGALGEDEEEDDESSYQRRLEMARLAAAKQREKEATDDAIEQRLHWLKNEMEKWKGFQLDLTTAGGSAAGAGPVFEV